MRIDTSNRTGAVNGRGAAGRSASGPAFVPAGADMPARASDAGLVAPMSGLDAILALQGVGSALEGRKRAVRRGTSMLDLLDSIKTDLLVGRMGADRLDNLAAQLATLRERVDPTLDAVLDDIELRVRVELAKFGRFPPL